MLEPPQNTGRFKDLNLTSIITSREVKPPYSLSFIFIDILHNNGNKNRQRRQSLLTIYYMVDHRIIRPA